MEDEIKQIVLAPWNMLKRFLLRKEDTEQELEMRHRAASTETSASRKISAALAMYDDYKRKAAKLDSKGIFAGYDGSRRPKNLLSLVYREGPVSQKELSTQIEPLPGALDIDMLNMDEDNDQTSSRSLLVYFARIAAGVEEAEKLDFHFVQSLLDSGASMSISDVHGQTIMHSVVRDWNVDVARFIVERNANVNQADKFGRTPMHLAAACNHPDMLKFLILQSADIDAKTLGECQTPLHYAAKQGSLACLKVLLMKGADIECKDFKMRTPIALAAEMGQEAAARYLLSAGASSNVVDKSGNRCIAFMVEKMPSFAVEALNQLFEVDESARKQKFHLFEIEYGKATNSTNTAKTILQMVAKSRSQEVIIHPLIVKLLESKWKYFGRYFTMAGCLASLILAGLFTSLTVTIGTHHVLYKPLEDHIWRIVVESLYISFSIFMFIQHILILNVKAKDERAWKEMRLADLKRDRIYCHPKWPSDRKFVKHEIEATETQKSGVLDDPWDWFEIIAFLFNVLLVVIHSIVMATSNTGDVEYTLHILYCINSFIVWFRVLKSLRGTSMMGDYIIMLGHVVSTTVRFFLLYSELLIPYVCSMWILFGGENNASKIASQEPQGPDSDTYELFSNFNNMLFYSWLLSANNNFVIRGAFHLDEVAGKAIVAFYLGVSTILFLNLYVALVSHLYVRLYQTVHSNALLTQARILDRQEQMLSQDQKKSLKNKVTKFLNPLQETYIAKIAESENAANAHRKMVQVKKQLDEAMRRAMLGDISKDYMQADGRAERISELFGQLYNQHDRINDKLDYLREFTATKNKGTQEKDDSKSVRSRP